jgi:hypothetical protein
MGLFDHSFGNLMQSCLTEVLDCGVQVFQAAMGVGIGTRPVMGRACLLLHHFAQSALNLFHLLPQLGDPIAFTVAAQNLGVLPMQLLKALVQFRDFGRMRPVSTFAAMRAILGFFQHAVGFALDLFGLLAVTGFKEFTSLASHRFRFAVQFIDFVGRGETDAHQQCEQGKEGLQCHPRSPGLGGEYLRFEDLRRSLDAPHL